MYAEQPDENCCSETCVAEAQTQNDLEALRRKKSWVGIFDGGIVTNYFRMFAITPFFVRWREDRFGKGRSAEVWFTFERRRWHGSTNPGSHSLKCDSPGMFG